MSTEELIIKAFECGFTHCCDIDIKTLVPQQFVRDSCAEGRCGAYGRNWTCPPAVGTLEECGARMQSYGSGLLLQTVARLEKTIDSRGYAAAEKHHNESLARFAELLRTEYPDALILGAGGCRICGKCVYPEPCRFPDRAISSMEAYGLFVTKVCRDNGLEYYYGEKTISYTACVLY